MKLLKLVIPIILFLLVSVLEAGAAQSTEDVTASDELKKEAKQRVLGKESTSVAVEPEYLIGHGDILRIRVYGEGSMSVSATSPSESQGSYSRSDDPGITVRIDGRISLKHIGDVEAVDMTLTQLADYLKILYATVFDDPILTVVLEKSNSQRYTVMGKVLKPGIYPIDAPINLVQVVARCAGFTEWANQELTVVRKDGNKSSSLFDGNTLKFDYGSFIRGRRLEKNITIKSGDIIIAH